AAELEHRQHGRVAELELQGESDDVEGGQRSAALDRKQWLALRLERRLHVGPGHEDALAGDVGPLVEHVVEQPETDVAHADFVRVRERARPFHPQLRQFLADGVQLAADVARWLLGREDEAIEYRKPHGPRLEHISLSVQPKSNGRQATISLSARHSGFACGPLPRSTSCGVARAMTTKAQKRWR